MAHNATPYIPANTEVIQGIAAGTQTALSGTVVFANSNGVTFGISGSSQVTASVVAAAQSNQTVGLYATGNTTQNSSTTLDARTVSFNALGAVTMGFSNGSVQVSSPNVSSIQGTGAISISSNGSTISVSGWNVTDFEPYPPSTSTTNYPNGIGTWYFEPFFLPANLSGGRLNRVVSFGSTASILRASSANFQTGTTGTRSASFIYANSVALYSRGAGTNSTRLESLWSNTFSIGISSSCSVSSAVNSLAVSLSAALSVITSINSAGAYTTTTIGSSTTFSVTATSVGSTNGTAYVSSFVNMLSGSWVMPVGFNSTVQPGQYWLAQAWSTSSTTAGTSGDILSYNSQFALSIPIIDTANSVRQWLQTVSTSNSQIFPGHGQYSATSNTPPSTVGFSQVNCLTASGIRQYFNFYNSTI